MARTIKSVGVTPEQRKKWLRLHEENGESVAQIAKHEGYDPRTIRKQLDLARQEREYRESRILVLRDAMQAHYSDLYKCTEKIEAALRSESSFDIKTADRMCKALYEHLPRSLLWKYLDKWNDICRNLDTAMESLTVKYADWLLQDSQLRKAFAEGKMENSAIVEFFTKQTRFWIKGFGVDIENALRVEAEKGGLANIRLGGYNIGKAPEANVEDIREGLLNFRREIHTFTEYQEAARLLAELEKLSPDIQEELAVISLKRVVPGRCKYCPM